MRAKSPSVGLTRQQLQASWNSNENWLTWQGDMLMLQMALARLRAKSWNCGSALPTRGRTQSKEMS